jgi:hypothetical protein
MHASATTGASCTAGVSGGDGPVWLRGGRPERLDRAVERFDHAQKHRKLFLPD